MEEFVSIDSFSGTIPHSRPVRILEREELISYHSREIHIRATLEVNCNKLDDTWSFGFIQGCDAMELVNEYGKSGRSLWEFHPLKSGRYKVLCDCDGEQWPYYSDRAHQVVHPNDSQEKTVIQLHLFDCLSARTICDLSYGEHKVDTLNSIKRNQSFIVWLVAIRHKQPPLRRVHQSEEGRRILFRHGEDDLFVLRSLEWKYILHISVDCRRRVGPRAKLEEDIADKPVVHDTPRQIPLHTLYPPCCNLAQSLIWYPNNDKEPCGLLVKPKDIIVDINTWLSEMVHKNRRILIPHGDEEPRQVDSHDSTATVGTVYPL